ncbi:MAG: SRPBCC family protein [Candidatus Omnitrophota bacterium]
MKEINSSIFVKAPKDIIFSVLKDIEKYPLYMKYVQNIEIKECLDNSKISKWTIDVDGADVVWLQKDEFNETTNELFFSQIKGDYTDYRGKWYVEEKAGKSRLTINMKIDWGIPSFEKLLGPVLERKIKRILRAMMIAIKLRSQKSLINIRR